MDDAPDRVPVYLTVDPLTDGQVITILAEIRGDLAIYGDNRDVLPGEGRCWHRTRWAAENYARQLQRARIAELRAEIERIERYRFGRPGR